MDLVISRYNENLDWINKLPIRDDINIVIYNKGQYIDKDNILLKNVGREAHTYITYILDNFDCLPNYVCFLQGNPFDHCQDVINKVVDFITNNEKLEFYFLSDLIINCRLDGGCWDDTLPVRKLYEKIYNLSEPSENIKITFGAGAQFIVKKENIIRYSKEFYKNILSMLDYSHEPVEAWAIERLWNIIFG